MSTECHHMPKPDGWFAEMSLRCHHDHQFAKELGEGDNSQIQCKLFQAA